MTPPDAASLSGKSYAERRAALGHSHVVRDSGRMLHLERAVMGTGLAMCGRAVWDWNEKSAQCWQDNPGQRCSQCEGPLGPKAVLKP